jgi:hypothetical protein
MATSPPTGAVAPPSPDTVPAVGSLPPVPPKSKLSVGAKVGLVVAIVVVVVVAAILAGAVPGVNPLGSKGGNSSSTAGSSATALPIATTFATVHGAGLLYGIFGISETTSFSAQLPDLNGSCPVQNPVNFTVPVDSVAYWKGSASGWLFVYWSGSNSTTDIVGVLGSTARLIASYVGAACSGPFPNLAPLPSTFVNSTSAADSANEFGAGFAAFVAAHGSANAEYTLTSTNDSFAPPVWNVYYTTCGIGPSSHTGVGDSALAVLDGAPPLGAPLTSNVSASASCSGGTNPIPGLGQTWYLGARVGASGTDGGPGHYVGLYNAATGGLNTSEFGLMITNSTTGIANATATIPSTCAVGRGADPTNCTPPAGSGWYAIIDYGSQITATYGGADAHWTYLTGTPIRVNSTAELVILSTTLFHGQPYLLSPFVDGSGLVVGSIPL